MIIYLLLMIITGFSFLYLLKKEIVTSDLILYVIPLGIVFHTIIFIILTIFNIYYTNILIILVTAITLLIAFIRFKNKKIKITNDIKKVPIFFIIFILFIGIKLISFAGTSFYNYYNDDEYRAWLTMPKIIDVNKDFKSIQDTNFKTYSTMLVANATMIYQFEDINMTSPRIFTAIFSIILIVGLYIVMVKNNVNSTISALLTILFTFSCVSFLNFSRGFSTNPVFMCFFIVSIFTIIDNYINNKEIQLIDIFVIIGALLTRGETLFLLLFVSFLLLLINKKNNKKSIQYLLLIIGIYIINKTMYYGLKPFAMYTNINNINIIERLKPNILFSNLSTGLIELLNPFVSNNYTLFYSFIFIIFIYLNKKVTNKTKLLFKTIILIELAYFVGTFFTQLFSFNNNEFLHSASFTRYNMMLMPLNYILIGIYTTFLIKDKMSNNKKLKK